MTGESTATTVPPPAPPFAEALRFWLKLGFISFGGPAGQIAIMHTELVERRRWIGERRFLHALGGDERGHHQRPQAEAHAQHLGEVGARKARMLGGRRGVVDHRRAIALLRAAVTAAEREYLRRAACTTSAATAGFSPKKMPATTGTWPYAM